VLTDGKLYYGNSGEELKAFNIQDGLGIKLLQQAGIQVGIITGRVSALLQRRADELGISPVIQGREDKLTALRELLQGMNLGLNEIAFMGDDLPDLSVINTVGLGITVANASSTLTTEAAWQTRRSGGDGAVREAAEMILRAQNKFDALVEQFK
jgi:3-deoxy-D-manno-octulosonate 8-phosphate phosphatase (KDO 8-P phosphatase)